MGAGLTNSSSEYIKTNLETIPQSVLLFFFLNREFLLGTSKNLDNAVPVSTLVWSL